MQQVAASKWEGSSPRMRGARPVKPSHLSTFRIIPAYAGSTKLTIVKDWSTSDHPRVCGEHRSSP